MHCSAYMHLAARHCHIPLFTPWTLAICEDHVSSRQRGSLPSRCWKFVMTTITLATTAEHRTPCAARENPSWVDTRTGTRSAPRQCDHYQHCETEYITCHCWNIDIQGTSVHVPRPSHMISLGSNTFLSRCAGDGMPLSTKQRDTRQPCVREIPDVAWPLGLLVYHLECVP